MKKDDNDLFKAYKYFAGEQENPYEGKDAGKYFGGKLKKMQPNEMIIKKRMSYLKR